jgi:tetratricopeptide (TPR) repeat protein
MTLKRKIFYALLVNVLIVLSAEGILAILRTPQVSQDEDPYVGFSGYLPLFQEESSSDGTRQFVTAPNKRALFNVQSFPTVKPPNGFRIFCMGGSTTYGHPYDYTTAFGNWLEAYLRRCDTGRDWQVINAGGVSYASYRVTKLMEELARYQPDLFVIYSGHNEFLEERTYREIIETPAWVRDLDAMLCRSRVYSALKTAYAPIRSGSAARYEMTAEVDEILGKTVGPTSYERDDVLRRAIVAHYRGNLERMIEIARAAGSEIVFVTPANNLKDAAPFKSEHREGLRAEELARWEELVTGARHLSELGDTAQALGLIDEALVLDDRYAALHFLRGRALYSLGRTVEAKAAFSRALDEDICPLRILTPMQQIVRDVAGERNVPLIEFDRMIENECERDGSGIPGEERFLDHVHPTIEGHRILALAILQRMIDRGAARPGPAWGAAAIGEIGRQLMDSVDTGMHARALQTLAKVIGWGGKLDEAHRLLLRCRDEFGEDSVTLAMLAQSAERQGRIDEAIGWYQRSVERDPNDLAIRFQLAELFRSSRRFPRAADEYRAIIAVAPGSILAHQDLAEVAVSLGRESEAIAEYRRVIELDSRLPDAHINLAVLYMRSGELGRAENCLRTALKLRPDDGYAYFGLGVVAEKRGDIVSAIRDYRLALKFDDRAVRTHNNLGVLLARQGNIEEAIEHFTAATRLDPSFADAAENLRSAREARVSR